MAFFGDSLENLFSHLPFFGGNGQNFFYDEAAALRAAMEASAREQQNPQARGPPPASQRALKSLPRIRISKEDLVDPVNRECCICLEPLELHDHALRLPCAHIFHPNCVQNWLQSACTCPVCRYELPTTDAAYEAGRVQRMKERKPRFARHELDRLPTKSLKELLGSSRYQAVDRQDLIDYLIKSGLIEIIAAPEPVEYSLKALRAMPVSKLRRCMNDEAGVFFDPKDVIEKEDMIRIFLLSGRLLVTPEPGEAEQENAASHFSPPVEHWDQDDAEEDDVKPPAVSRAPIVETVSCEEEVEADERTNRDLIMEESETPYEEHSNHTEAAGAETTMPPEASVDDGESIDPVDCMARPIHSDFEATIDEPDQRDVGEAMDGSCDFRPAPSPSFSEPNVEENSASLPDCVQNAEVGSTESDPTESQTQNDDSRQSRKRPLQTDSQALTQTNNAGDENDDAQSPFGSLSISQLKHCGRAMSVDLSDCIERSEMIHRLSQMATINTVDDGNIHSRFDRLSISQLRYLGRAMSVDLSDCVERAEMIRRLSSVDSELDLSTDANTGDHEDCVFVDESIMQEWSFSEIRSVARLIDIDLSAFPASRDDMVRKLCRGAMERNHASRFLLALVPFVGLSVPQLRAVAREMGIDVRHCLEKDDFLTTIVESKLAQVS